MELVDLVREEFSKIIETRGLEIHQGVEQLMNSDEKYIGIFLKVTKNCRMGWNERRVIGSFSFYDGSMVMITGIAQLFKIFTAMSTRNVQDDA